MKTLTLLLLLLSNITYADENNASEPQNKPPEFQGFIWGAGVAYQQQIYKGFDQRTIAIPLLGYVGEKLNVFGPFVSYTLVDNNNWGFDLNLSPRFTGYEEDDSDFFNDMDERKDSLDAGFSLKYNPNTWSFQFKALADVLSKSDGSEFEISMAKKFRKNSFTIEPSVSINHLDKNMIDYYYGVRQEESLATRSFYEGSSSQTQSLKLSISTPLPVGLIRMDLNSTWYGSGITDSPLVDSDQSFGARIFFITFF